jgi:O-acetyl-ADP-ribose deacetylase (regulator of RNase III)
VSEVKKLGIQSIAIPPLGCGLGGLEWAEVSPKIETAFADLSNIKVIVLTTPDLPRAVRETD